MRLCLFWSVAGADDRWAPSRRRSFADGAIRPRDGAGNEIYGVYFGPFATREQACRARSSWGGDSYVKVLDMWVPSRSSTSCDLGIFVYQPAEPVMTSEVQVGL